MVISAHCPGQVPRRRGISIFATSCRRRANGTLPDIPRNQESVVDKRVERRLRAIFAGDVVGYSRLMGADEEATMPIDRCAESSTWLSRMTATSN